MSINSIGPAGSLPQSVTALKARLEALQTQLATGQKAVTYGGLGQARSLSLGLRAQIGEINFFKSTIQTANLRLEVADNTLQRIQGVADENRSSLLVSPYLPGGDSRTPTQYSADATLIELVSLLNSEVDGHHLFAGRSANSPPVVNETVMLDGDAGRAGFRQVLNERRLADLGGDLHALTSVVGTGATASTADAFATITSGNLGTDADVSATGTAIGTGSAYDINGVISATDQLLIEVDGTTYTVDFTATTAAHSVASNTLTFNLGNAANTVDDLTAELDTLLNAAGVTVTDAADGSLTFAADTSATEYIRFTDGVGNNVTDLGLQATGSGAGATDRLATRNAIIADLAASGTSTLDVSFGGASVGTVSFGTGTGISNLAELVATIDAYAGVSASGTSDLTISTTDVTDADSTIVLSGDSNSTLETVLGYVPDFALGSAATVLPTNLLSPANGLTQGDTLSIKVGTQTTNITFGVNAGEISTLAELNTRLNAITAGAASVVTGGGGIGNISITAGNVGESITISGSFNTAARFGLTEGIFSEALTSVVGIGATATTADAFATIDSGAIGADADVSATGTAIGTGSAYDINGVVTATDQLLIEVDGTTYTVDFTAATTAHSVASNTLTFNLGNAANTVDDLAGQLDTLLGAAVTVTDAADGALTFAAAASTTEYIRFTDSVGTNVADLGLGAAGFGAGATDRLATRNATLDQLAFEAATLQVDFGGGTVGTVSFGTGTGISNLAELVATIDGYAGVSAFETAGVLTVQTTNPTDADSTIVLSGDSNSTLQTVLGYAPDVGGGLVATATPTNLLSPANGLTQGDTLSLKIGTQTTNITFGVNAGEISTLAELNTVLAAISPGSAAVVTAGSSTGNISVSAGSANDSITVSGSPGTAARFGLTEGVFSDLVLGRLVVPTAVGTSVTVSEDFDGHPFGFKLTSVSSGLTGTTVTGPFGTPTSIQVSFSASLPIAGEEIAIRVDLPDGSNAEIRLTATAASPPDDGEFTIGIDDLTTTSSFETALRVEISQVARTKLAAAAAIESTTNFFDYDSGNPPQRVDGPPFETATGLVDGTVTDTVFWYEGDLDVAGRDSAVARIDSSLSVAYGARADEAALRDVVKYIALLATERFDVNTTTDEERYHELKNRLIPRLAQADGRPKVRDIAIELAQKNIVINSIDARHDETLVFARATLDNVEGANLEEVATSILRLQVQLQASFEVTSIMARISIINFL